MTRGIALPLLLLCATGQVCRAQPAGTFTATGEMITPRIFHTATLLLNGKVLIAGGQAHDLGPPLASAEIYDPDTGAFTGTGGMIVPRNKHTATLLPNGQVLIVSADFWSPAEIYDPSTGAFTAVGNSASANMNCNAATLLGNGRVLVNVGTVWPGPRALGATAELFDPASGTFAATNGYSDIPHNTFFPCPLATLLPDGKVLITWDAPEAELYDPDTVSFRLTRGGMRDDYGPWTTTVLTTGKVLITTETTSELYDPQTETFTVTGAPPLYNTATPLSDGTVLFTGGCHASPCDSSDAAAELYAPDSGTFTATGCMTTPRSWHTATLLRDGTVLIAGGVVNTSYVPTATAEIYTPSATRPAPPILWTGGGQAVIPHASTQQPVSPRPENPAVAGEPLEIYVTGLIEDGRIPPQVFVGGQMAEVLSFGAAPGNPGYNQVNVRVPCGVGAGLRVPVRLTYINRPSNEVTIGVRNQFAKGCR